MGWKEKFEETKNELRGLNGTVPDITKAFGGLGKAVKQAEALDEKTKEFVALGIAVHVKCEACIMFHVEALIRCGATREEVAETVGVAIQMGGGPAMMYGAKALECFDEFSA